MPEKDQLNGAQEGFHLFLKRQIKTKRVGIRKKYQKNHLLPVVATPEGEIFELPGYRAAAMAGRNRVVLTEEETIPMPYGSELMMLPERKVVVFNEETNQIEVLSNNPYSPGQPIYPVSVFNSPGYVNRYFCAYETPDPGKILPLFSYGAVGWGNQGFQSAAILVDRERRQDLRLMPHKKIVAGIRKMQKNYPENRLMRHLEGCALTYGCPAAKNFFLSRCEAPLPTSTACNADCLGCISLQKEDNLTACQERIRFIPKPLEIAEVALEHIGKVNKSIVSFGQGCEGDPLLSFHVIEPAVKAIRKATQAGTINLNTNAGIPERVEKLFEAGLDAMRVSMNSVRKECYTAYFRPKTYTFEAVEKSIDIALGKGKFVSINYLNCPGFTDSEAEYEALTGFLERYPVSMIQWRNLNFDPRRYIRDMEALSGASQPLGMLQIIEGLKKRFPNLKHGYFNPPKENFMPSSDPT